MKRILFILICLVSIAQAQTPPGNYTGIAQRYQWIAGRFKDGLAGPAGTDTSLAWVAGVWRISGSQFTDTSGAGQGHYIYYNNRWNLSSGGGTSPLFGRTDTRNATGNPFDFSNGGNGGVIDSLSSSVNEFTLLGYSNDGSDIENRISWSPGGGGLILNSNRPATGVNADITITPTQVSLSQSANTHQISINNDSIKIFQSILSADTTTFKPLGVTPTGGISRMSYWPGGGGGGGATNFDDVLNNGNVTDDHMIFGTQRTIVGTVLNDNFNRAGLGANYDSSLATITMVYNSAWLGVPTGNNTFNNYITYTNATGRNRWKNSWKIISTDSVANSAVNIGLRTNNAFYDGDFTIRFITDNSSNRGRMALYNPANGQFELGTQQLSFTTADTTVMTVERVDNVLYGLWENLRTGSAISYSYTIPTTSVGTMVLPGSGKHVIYFISGALKVFNNNISSNEAKQKVLFVGNSITAGYAVPLLSDRYVSKIFPGRYAYEINGGSGDVSAQLASRVSEINTTDPNYVVINIGVNDAVYSVANATFSANVEAFVVAMKAAGAIPIIVSACPTNAFDLTVKNDTLLQIATRQSVKFINTFDSLRNGTQWKTVYNSGDGVHPGVEGMKAIARIIARQAPEILAYDTIMFAGQPKFSETAAYGYGYDPLTGQTVLYNAVADNSNLVQLNPVVQQPGSPNIFGTMSVSKILLGGGAALNSGYFESIFGGLSGNTVAGIGNSNAAGYGGWNIHNNAATLSGQIVFGNASVAQVNDRAAISIRTRLTGGKVNLYGDNWGASDEPGVSVGAGVTGVGEISPDRRLHVAAKDAVTNATTYINRYTHETSGTAAVSFGAGTEWELENASGTLRIGASEQIITTDATNTTEDFDWSLSLMRAGSLTEALRVLGTGDLAPKRVQATTAIDSMLTMKDGLIKYSTAIAVGTYTPTIGNTANVDASTAHTLQYMRVGNEVTVSGYVEIDATAITNTVFTLTLPVASNFAAIENAGGTGQTPYSAGWSIEADATNDVVGFKGLPTTTINDKIHFSFTYRII